jgi:hypothetical protein
LDIYDQITIPGVLTFRFSIGTPSSILDTNLENSFGHAIGLSSDGTFAIVTTTGSQSESLSGRVFIYNLSVPLSDQPVLIFEWIPTGSASHWSFGFSLSLSANDKVLMIASPFAGESGEVSIFLQDNNGHFYYLDKVFPPLFSMRQHYTTSQGGGGHFGWSMDINDDGSILAIGAPYENHFTGAIYLFQRNESKWQLFQKLQGIRSKSFFGISISLSAQSCILSTIVLKDTFDLSAIKIFSACSSNQNKNESYKQVHSLYNQNIIHIYTTSRDGSTLAILTDKLKSNEIHLFS